MLQDGPHLQQRQSVTAEGTRTERLSRLRRRYYCGSFKGRVLVLNGFELPFNL